MLADDGALGVRVRYLSTQAWQPVMRYEHTDIGSNYRLSNILAALGRAQFARLDQILARRRQVRQSYREVLASTPGVAIIDGGDDSADNSWLTSIVVDERAGWTAVELSAHLDQHDIESRPPWKPMLLQQVFSDARALVNSNSHRLFDHGLTLPSGSGMAPAQFDRVIDALEPFASRAIRE